MGFVLLASFLGIIGAMIGVIELDLGWMSALAVWSFGGTLSAALAVTLGQLRAMESIANRSPIRR
ncbi:hypothetical protein [Rubellimicrobium arenae]|uniref:hypothetical protein n=1 Tax=Rubellimicrobium arenae TaxID=2817372 RepID=UPI001B30A722|nr:hypothetical protein [Rubellimicrobium arenae]